MGLIGGGGSILTLPILVYLLGLSPVLATSYSLFVVGSTALVGTLTTLKKYLINYTTGILFVIPSLISVVLVRRFVVPYLPDLLFSIYNYRFTKDVFIMLLFSIILALAGISMMKSKVKPNISDQVTYTVSRYFSVFSQAIGIGVLAGLVGAGGGFLIVPALTLSVKLPIKNAISTSLFIIAIQSIFGFFIGDFHIVEIDWKFLGLFTSISLLGLLFGIKLSQKTSSTRLKYYFGFFTLGMAIVIFIEEIFMINTQG